MLKILFLSLFFGLLGQNLAKADDFKDISPKVYQLNSIIQKDKAEDDLKNALESVEKNQLKTILGTPLVELKPKEEEFIPSNIFRVKGDLSLKKISSTDFSNGQKADIVPGVSPLFDAEWEYGIVKKINLVAGINFNWFKIYDDPQYTKVLSTEKSLWGFNLGAKYIWNNSTSTQVLLENRDYVFYVGINKYFIDLDTVNLWGARVSQNFDVYDINDMTFGLDLEYGFIGAGRGSFYKVKQGNSQKFEIYSKNIISKMPVKFSLYYKIINQKSELADQKQTDMGVSVQFQWGE